VASEQRPVLVSRFAPDTLSSSGAVVSEAQPEASQATARTLIMVFMDCPAWLKVESTRLRYGCSLSQSNCTSIAPFGDCVTTVIQGLGPMGLPETTIENVIPRPSRQIELG
jgi:hypothetical protein